MARFRHELRISVGGTCDARAMRCAVHACRIKQSFGYTVGGSSCGFFSKKKSNRLPAAKQPSDGPYITQFGHAESRGRIGLAPKHRECGANRVQTGGVGISTEHVNPPTAPRRHMHGNMRVPAGPFLRLVFGGSSLRLGAHIWLSPAGSRPLAWYCGHQQQPAHEAPELCGRVGE